MIQSSFGSLYLLLHSKELQKLLGLPGSSPVPHLAAHAALLEDAARQPPVPPHQRDVVWAQAQHRAKVIAAIAHVHSTLVALGRVTCAVCVQLSACVSLNLGCYAPLHILALQPTVHPCCGPLRGMRRLKRSSPFGSQCAGFVTISLKSGGSISPLF